MERIKVIVLDADNCIFLDEDTREGSEEIKDQAWFDVFPEYDRETLNTVIEQVKNAIVGGKGDRNDIAKCILKHFNFSDEEIANEVVKRCDLFDEIVQERIILISITLEVQKILKNLSARFPLYINTATPRESILKTLQALGLDFFKGIYGRPGTKVSNLQDILLREAVRPDEMLFVGDAYSDHEAAKEVGCRFIGMSTKRNIAWHEPQAFPVIGSLAELGDILQG